MTDEEWFEEQWHRHSPAIWAFARRRVGESEADDVVVDSYLVLWQKLPLRHDLFWLLGVARHLVGNRYRSHERQGRLIERIGNQRSENTGDQTDSYAEISAVEAAIEQLNAREREAVLLVAWDGLSPADAALVVGCSGSTFRMRLSRGRRRLRVLLRNPEIHVSIERD